jgi:hypothetical protein
MGSRYNLVYESLTNRRRFGLVHIKPYALIYLMTLCQKSGFL